MIIEPIVAGVSKAAIRLALLDVKPHKVCDKDVVLYYCRMLTLPCMVDTSMNSSCQLFEKGLEQGKNVYPFGTVGVTNKTKDTNYNFGTWATLPFWVSLAGPQAKVKVLNKDYQMDGGFEYFDLLYDNLVSWRRPRQFPFDRREMKVYYGDYAIFCPYWTNAHDRVEPSNHAIPAFWKRRAMECGVNLPFSTDTFNPVRCTLEELHYKPYTHQIPYAQPEAPKHDPIQQLVQFWDQKAPKPGANKYFHTVLNEFYEKMYGSPLYATTKQPVRDNNKKRKLS